MTILSIFCRRPGRRPSSRLQLSQAVLISGFGRRLGIQKKTYIFSAALGSSGPVNAVADRGVPAGDDLISFAIRSYRGNHEGAISRTELGVSPPSLLLLFRPAALWFEAQSLARNYHAGV